MPVLIWIAGARGANALRVVRCLLIALDDSNREALLQFADRARQQRGLARARTRHEIQRESSRSRQTRAVLGGIAIVLAQNVALDPDDALLRQAGDVNAGRPRAKIDRGRGAFAQGAIGVAVIMIAVIMKTRVVVLMRVIMRVIMSTAMRMTVLRFDAGLSFDARCPASADRAHHSTSNSFTRMSSPAATCT